jgi:hypothetical protein
MILDLFTLNREMTKKAKEEMKKFSDERFKEIFAHDMKLLLK